MGIRGKGIGQQKKIPPFGGIIQNYSLVPYPYSLLPAFLCLFEFHLALSTVQCRRAALCAVWGACRKLALTRFFHHAAMLDPLAETVKH